MKQVGFVNYSCNSHMHESFHVYSKKCQGIWEISITCHKWSWDLI